MALQQNIEQPNGIVLSYWKISLVATQYHMDNDYAGNTHITVVVDGYLNSQTREDGHSPATRQNFKITNPPVWTAVCGNDGRNSTSDNPVRLAYEWLKSQTTEFAGAVDC